MSTSSSATISSTPPNTRAEKSNKNTKVVIFKLPATSLRPFLPKPMPRQNSKATSTPSSASTPTNTQNGPAALPSSPAGEASESNATPAPDAANPPKKKGAGARAGTKRSLGLVNDGGPKSRGKPGPKKKARLDDTVVDQNGKPVNGGLTNGTHKLGPKANQGAINAGLRALDRSGKPCRKWERKPIQLKSFTGVMWELPSWRAPKTKLPEEGSEAKDGSQPSGSKANESSTARESEKSNTGDNGAEQMIESTPAASSPLPAPLAPTIVATG